MIEVFFNTLIQLIIKLYFYYFKFNFTIYKIILYTFFFKKQNR